MKLYDVIKPKKNIYIFNKLSIYIMTAIRVDCVIQSYNQVSFSSLEDSESIKWYPVVGCCNQMELKHILKQLKLDRV